MVIEDAEKLRTCCYDLEKWIITFWWGEKENQKRDIDDAKIFCKNGLNICYLSCFPTKLAIQQDGYFAFCVIRVS